MKKSNPVEIGLAELSGIQVCAGPNCRRLLTTAQGRQTPKGRMCFSCAPREVTS